MKLFKSAQSQMPRSRLTYLTSGPRAFLNSHSACIGLLILAILFAWTASSWYFIVQKIVQYYDPLPNWDYWNVVQHLPAYRAFDFGVLWQQHNEHRIIFPEIVFAADMLYLHGRQTLPLVISFACYFSTWLMMSWALFSDRNLPLTVRCSAISLAGIVFAWKGSGITLGTPFLLQWTLTQAAVVLAFCLIHLLKSSSRLIYLVGVVTFGVVATYSSGNGMLVWPLILAIGLLVSLSKRNMFVLAVSAVLSIGLYFVKYKVLGSLNLMDLVLHPIYLVGFLSSYISLPLGFFERGWFGACCGLVNLVLFFFLLIIALRTRLITSRPGIVLLGYSAFTFLTALLTAAGRMDPNDPTFTGAKAARFLSVPLVNWGALLLAFVWMAGRRHWRLVRPAYILVVVIVLMLAASRRLRPWVAGNDVLFARQQWATLSIENGLLDPDLVRYVHPSLLTIKPFLQWLRDDHLSCFYRGYSGLLGKSLASSFPEPSTRPQLGGVMRIVPVQGGVEIEGWTAQAPPERLVFVDESGRIIGLGRKLPAGAPPDFGSSGAPFQLAWVGFINSKFGNESFSTYSFGPHEGRPTLVSGPRVCSGDGVIGLHSSQ